MWQDDFEPNYMKDNQGGAWLLTLTIETTESGSVTLQNVYPMAVGPKDSDHHILMTEIWKNLLLLKAEGEVRMYNGKKKFMENVSCHVLAVTMDQPECRATNGLLLGGSTSMSWFGYKVDLSQFVHNICPCKNCDKQLYKDHAWNQHWEPPKCTKCINWMSLPVEELEYNPPENFPKPELNANSKINGKKLCYAALKAHVDKAHQKVIASEWNKTEASSYLKACGLKTSCVKIAIKCMTNCHGYQMALQKQCDGEPDSQQIVQAYKEQKSKKPFMFQKWAGPPIWYSGIYIQQSHQAGMHILHLGIAKTMVLVVQDWAAGRKKYSAMVTKLGMNCGMIEKLGLLWLKVQPYTGAKLGSWYSENFMGFI